MKNDLFEEHLEQQLIVELWSQNRGIDNLEVPDFTDYLFRNKEVIRDYDELDCCYELWSFIMR